MQRSATAVWQGDIKGGKGTITTQSTALSSAQYSFSTRFENGIGTNPEELLAAAHAGCYSMALSLQLTMAGTPPESIQTTCTVTLDKVEGGFSITESHLDVTAKLPGGDREKFEKAAAEAKAGCPLSKVMNAKITMDTHFKG